jgi:predicted porin
MMKSSKWYYIQFALLPIALPCQLAHAQSSVTLYGVVDESVRYITNANKAGDSTFSLGNGGMTQNCWSLKGASTTSVEGGRHSAS